MMNEDDEVQKRINEEYREFGDIVQVTPFACWFFWHELKLDLVERHFCFTLLFHTIVSATNVVIGK